MNAVQDSVGFLIESVFQLFMLFVLLRFLFQLLKVDFRNPMVAPIVKLTQAPLAWLRRYVPGLWGIDLSALVLLLILGVVKLLLLSVIKGGAFSVVGGLVWTTASLLNTTIWIFIISIFAQAIMSWFAPRPTPITSLLGDMTRAILSPIRRYLPGMAGIDFSPIVAFLGLNFIQKLIVQPLFHTAMQLM
ncbi:MAG: YggT family protein [Arenicellales bacterium]